MHSNFRIRQLIILLFFFSLSASAQDMHFTNYGITPGYFNPALNGNFSGTVRAGLIFRDQHEFISSSVQANPYRTFGIAVDAPITFGFKKTHWLGAGLAILSDNVGLTAGLDGVQSPISQKWSRFAPGVSYNIGLDKKFTSVLSIGIQYGLTTVGYNGTDAYTEQRYLGNTNDVDLIRFNPTGGNNDGISGNYGSINVGVTYKSILNKTASLELGAAMMHLQNPSFRIKNGNPATVNRRMNIHGVYRAATTKRLIIEPALYATFMGGASNIQAQFRTEYLTKPKGDLALIFGAGYRLGDAPQLLTGARYKDWLFSLSYDYALSEAADISPHKLELGAAKVFTLNKRPKLVPIQYCPRL